jgi:hypothetical protein
MEPPVAMIKTLHLTGSQIVAYNKVEEEINMNQICITKKRSECKNHVNGDQDSDTSGYNIFEGWNTILGANPGNRTGPSPQQNGAKDPAGPQDVHEPTANFKSLRIFFNLKKHFDSLDIGMAAVVDLNSFNFTRRCRYKLTFTALKLPKIQFSFIDNSFQR